MTEKDGGPAFPVTYQHDNGVAGVKSQEWVGMSLRDYFAVHLAHGKITVGLPGATAESYRHIARNAYGIADAMLAERAK